MLDVDDVAHARFGLLDGDLDYGHSLEAGPQRLHSLPPARLASEVKVNGKVYRAVTCKAGTDTNVKRLSSVRLWESGRLVQHFDLLKLKFDNDAGTPLECDGTLDLLAWPGSLTLNVELTPGSNHDRASGSHRSASDRKAWTDAELRVRLISERSTWHAKRRIASVWKSGQLERHATGHAVET